MKSLDAQPPLAGLAQGGWKLIYNATPNKQLESRSKVRKNIDLRFSLGLIIDNQGDDHAIIDVVPGSPADKAGIGPNMKLLGVNGRKFDVDLLKDAIVDTPRTSHIDLLLENASYFINAKLNYNAGPRFPHLERVADAKDVLTTVIGPRTKSPAEKK
jgi:predicted metalloprotease with PDZ domain